MDQDQAAAAAYFGSIYPPVVWVVNRRVRQDGGSWMVFKMAALFNITQ